MKLTLPLALKIFEDFLLSSGYKEETIFTKLSEAKAFYIFLQSRKGSKDDFKNINHEDIKAFIEHLHKTVSPLTEKPYRHRTKINKLGAIRLLFKSLYLNERILINPVKDFHLERPQEDNKRKIFSLEQMEKFLDKIDINSPLGLRDRAIFELIYSSAIRTSEVCNLDIGNMDFDTRLLLIQCGKFSKDRIVPVSEVASRFLKKYLTGRMKKSEPLFLGKYGRISPRTVRRRFKEYLKIAGIAKDGLCVHSIRHTTATHLLENGAGIRHVQELLGHESIETTAKYTHTLIESLKKVYRSFHPRENDFYREVEPEYDKRLNAFYNELIKKKAESRKPEVIERKRKWAEKRKKNTNS